MMNGSPYASMTSASLSHGGGPASEPLRIQDDYGLFGSQQQCAPSLYLSLFFFSSLLLSSLELSDTKVHAP